MLRQAECRNPPKENNCFFCGEVGTEATPLHEAMTPRITHRVRQCALKLQDHKLIAKLSHSDLVAQEAKYHANCLVKLYNASNRKTEEDEKENFDRVSHGIALVELMGYTEDTKLSVKDIQVGGSSAALHRPTGRVGSRDNWTYSFHRSKKSDTRKHARASSI